MALNGLICAEVPLRNYSVTLMTCQYNWFYSVVTDMAAGCSVDCSYAGHHGEGHSALMAVVCHVPDSKWRTEAHRKLKFGIKETHDTGEQVTRDPIYKGKR